MANNEMTMEQFFAVMEYPFTHSEMTMEEFLEEREYFLQHHKEYREGTYQPLWKQRENNHAV